jgi:hypothetical protein
MASAPRQILSGIAILLVIATGVFVAQPPWLADLWPFAGTTPMTYLFVGSILLAAAASIAWCLYADEPGALVGVGLDGAVIFGPVTVLVLVAGLSRGDSRLAMSAIGAAAVVVGGAALALWARRFPIRDNRPTPLIARASMAGFTVVLITAGVLLLAGVPNILPWSVTPDLSAVVGLFFVGAAAYFAYGAVRPVTGNAFGQLAGFLAYDLVLIVPFLQRLPTIVPEQRLSLYLYIVVVVYSGLLAVAVLTRWGGFRRPRPKVAVHLPASRNGHP